MPRGVRNSKIDKNGRECSACGKYKAWANYWKDKGSSTGHFAKCNACVLGARSSAVTTKPVKSVNTMSCHECNQVKSVSDFRARRKDYGGGHYSTCLDCWAKRKSANSVITSDLSEEGLDFTKILHFKKQAKNSWTYAEVLRLMQGLILEGDKGVMKITEIYARYAPDRKSSGCTSIRNEIIQAIKESQDKGLKFNLKEYWHGDRKFSARAEKEKVVWKKKK